MALRYHPYNLDTVALLSFDDVHVTVAFLGRFLILNLYFSPAVIVTDFLLSPGPDDAYTSLKEKAKQNRTIRTAAAIHKKRFPFIG